MRLSLSPLLSQIVSHNAGNQPEIVKWPQLQEGRLTVDQGFSLSDTQCCPSWLAEENTTISYRLHFISSKPQNEVNKQ